MYCLCIIKKSTRVENPLRRQRYKLARGAAEEEEEDDDEEEDAARRILNVIKCVFHDLKHTFGERMSHTRGSNLRNLIVGTSKLVNYLGRWIELGTVNSVD
jgi:hypothetical protein